MDICKLSDNLEAKASRDVVAFSLVITDLKQGVRNAERVNVYVNNKFSFSLDVSQIVDLGIKVGLEISVEELAELKKASEFGKLYQRALEWVLFRPHSERECRDYLRRKIFEKKLDSDFVDKIIKKLRDKKYLDDSKFAEWYVQNRFLKKGVSVKRLGMELTKKGISKEIVDGVLRGSERNDRDEILKIIAEKRVRYSDDEKLKAYLVRQGFDYQLVRDLVGESSSISDEE